MNISGTMWPSLSEPQGKRFATTWAKMVERLSVPRVSAVKEGVGFSLATFANDYRLLANVERVYALGFDFDKDVNLAALRIGFSAAASLLHTTWQSTPEVPRVRVFLLLSRPVTGPEYRAMYGHAAGVLTAGGHIVDRAASDPSRLWFAPSKRPGGTFEVFEGVGPPVPVPDVIEVPSTVAPPLRPIPPRDSSDHPDWARAFERARSYVAACPGAISGSGGHAITFALAQKLVRGFSLSPDEALSLMLEWNQKCQPPWGERELRHKISSAITVGRHRDADMLGPRRARR